MVTPLSWKLDIDVARIDGVVTYNSFSPNCVKKSTPETLASATQRSEDKNPSALYAYPSLFNHSCHPSAVWNCFGDIMVIRARETITQGTEITLAYAVGTTHITRGEKLASLLQGPCDCVLCISDRAVGDHACLWNGKLLNRIAFDAQARRWIPSLRRPMCELLHRRTVPMPPFPARPCSQLTLTRCNL
jgi:hypothetical protein